MTTLKFNLPLAFVCLIVIIVLAQCCQTSQSSDYKCLPYFNSFDKKVDEKHDRLFGTKTAYLTARQNIRKQFNHHQWPVDENKCRPVYFYLLSRHTIRYPKMAEITELRNFLYPLRDDIVKNSLDLRFKQLANWKFQMNETDDNQVSDSGRIETAKVAKIFYDYFPELLDVNKIHFDVGYTPKIRTKQTSDSFVDSLIKEQIMNNVDHSNLDKTINEIRNKKFYEYQNDLLMSHRVCKTRLKDKLKKLKTPEAYTKLAQSDAFTMMLNGFSDRIGLPYTLSLDSLLLIYRICIYEDAILYDSPWCHLFTSAELQMIEYLLDITEYYDAHAIKPYRELGCTVASDLYRKVNTIIRSNQLNTNATLYFSHENLLSKWLSYLDLFDHFPSYEQDDDRLCLPEGRHWRASNILSFGTNFATILYKCNANNNNNGNDEMAKDGGYDQYNRSFHMLTLINEIPVTIRGCSSAFCPVEEFFNEYRSTLDNCDLNVICK